MQRQPDALQPDDEHELQPAAGHGHCERGDVAGGEGPYPEQAQLEQRIDHPALDHHERAEQEGAADRGARRPAGLVQPWAWWP